MAFYKKHPLAGPKYGDFHLQKQWTEAPIRVLCLGQDRGVMLQLELREFIPPAGDNDQDLKGRSMYAVPWAIANVDDAVKAINAYVDESIGLYLDAILDDTDGLVWSVFHAAYRLSIFPEPVRF
jgi:hypothetical protein